MPINLKVKTLDAQTHEFSINDEITVREFKDKIAQKTNISAEQQRIIYCGRVLADEKQLKEYDVDGKVVHVAERPPPSQRATSSVSSAPLGNMANTVNDRRVRARAAAAAAGMRNSPIFRALDGMVVGTVAIPMNSNNNNRQAPVNPFTASSSFCMNRITVARHMLQCIDNIAAYLEDPSRGLNNTSLDILASGRWTMESTVVEVGISGEVPQNQNIVEMVQGAVSAALRRNGNTNVAVLQMPASNISDNLSTTARVLIQNITEDEDGVTVNNDSEAATINNSAGDDTGSDSGVSTNSGRETGAQVQNQNNANNTDTNISNGSGRRRTGTQVLAEVIEQMRNVQNRLNPFVEQFYNLLQNEPVFGENDTEARENAQRLFDRVSEAFHYMSHAQHAISDLMLDVSQPTPRYLACRPILVDQSGYVSSNNVFTQAFIPPSLRQHMIPQQQTGRNNWNSNSSNASTSVAATAGGSSASTTSTTSDTNSSTVEDPIDEPISWPPSINATSAGSANSSNDNHQSQMARFLQAVVNSAPADTEFHVHIDAPTITTVDVSLGQTQQATVVTGNTTQSSNNSATNATGRNSSGNQARVTTITLPTTSTQTRSTARPQIANIPVTFNMPSAWNGSRTPNNNSISTFDRFLPCNSHHVRDPESAGSNSGNARGNTATPNTASLGTATTNGAATTTGSGNIGSTMVNALRTNNTNRSATATRLNFLHLRNLISNMARSSVTATMGGAANVATSATDVGGNDATAINSPPVPDIDTSTIRSLHTQLMNFFNDRIFEGNPINEETTPLAINRAVQWFGTTLLYLIQFERPEYDSRRSLFNILKSTLPLVIDLLKNQNQEKDLPEFKKKLREICEQFRKRLYSVLYVCIGRDNAEMYWVQLMRLLLMQLEKNLAGEALRFLCVYLNPIAPATDESDAQQFLVHRRETRQTEMQEQQTSSENTCVPMDTDIDMTEEASTSQTETPATDESDAQQFLVHRRETRQTEMQEQQTSSENTCVPMDTDIDMTEEASTSQTETYDEPLPTVVAGSETWHRNLPTDWLPIITRDMQRQAESPPNQPPFSDVYISGMSAKRRKLIRSSKLPNDIGALVTDSVCKAMQTVGVGSPSASSTQIQALENVARAIASDAAVQSSYTEALRTNVRKRLKDDKNYTPEKYPKATKFIKK
uniref:BCL2-associated athanogene 6 n=1 Tax=Glossina palpalis gambiensis TaxID=67801 RepID=A0A1B0C4D4_9MUSC